MNIRSLHAHFVAEVTDIDLRAPQDASNIVALQQALDAHSVLVFPDQALSGEQHVAFSRCFGELEILQKGLPGRQDAGGDRIWISNVIAARCQSDSNGSPSS